MKWPHLASLVVGSGSCLIGWLEVAATVVTEPSPGGRRRSGDGRGRAFRVGGQPPFLCAAFEAVAEAPALGAGVDDVRAVGDPVNDGLRHAERRGTPSSIPRTAGSWSRSAMPRSLRSEMTWKTSSAAPSGKAKIAQLIQDHDLGAGVAADDPGELPA